jgi:hypothetical protein
MRRHGDKTLVTMSSQKIRGVDPFSISKECHPHIHIDAE